MAASSQISAAVGEEGRFEQERVVLWSLAFFLAAQGPFDTEELSAVVSRVRLPRRCTWAARFCSASSPLDVPCCLPLLGEDVLDRVAAAWDLRLVRLCAQPVLDGLEVHTHPAPG